MAVSLQITDDGCYQFKGNSFQATEDKNKLLAPYDKQVVHWGQKFELQPTAEQAAALNQQIGNARFLRNRYLSMRNEYYKKQKEAGSDDLTLTPAVFKKEYLPALKKEFPFLQLSDKFALENAVLNVEDAFKRFFSHQNSFPKFASRFKPNGNRYQTDFTNGNLDIVRNEGFFYAKIPKVGRVRILLDVNEAGMVRYPIFHRNSRIGKVSISREGTRYFISYTVEEVVDLNHPEIELCSQDVFGLDLGLKSFCVYGSLDQKEKVDNPRWIKVHEKRLRRLQQSLARKQYDPETHTGSKNRDKAKEKVRKEYRKIANQRKDFQHKLSRKIADSCKVFLCENLNIKGMMKNRHLSKAIASVGWGQFIQMVKYKVERNNGTFLQVSRCFPSTKLCSCGYKNDDLTLGDRFWVCPKCHQVHDRDAHAVDNLIVEGMSMLIDNGFTFRPSGYLNSLRPESKCKQ